LVSGRVCAQILDAFWRAKSRRERLACEPRLKLSLQQTDSYGVSISVRIRKVIGILLFRSIETSEIFFDQDTQASLTIDALFALYTDLLG